jgi:hypothetical protein
LAARTPAENPLQPPDPAPACGNLLVTEHQTGLPVANSFCFRQFVTLFHCHYGKAQLSHTHARRFPDTTGARDNRIKVLEHHVWKHRNGEDSAGR